MRLPPAVNDVFMWLWDLRVPVIVVGIFSVAPKMVLLWIAFVLAKAIAEIAYTHSPQVIKDRVVRCMPARFAENEYIREINEGAEQTLPFLLLFIYLVCAPFAVMWILWDWCASFLPEKEFQPSASNASFVLKQNKYRDNPQESNFYHSKVFAVTILAVFASGLPALFTWSLYTKLGIEQHVAHDAHAFSVPVFSMPLPDPKVRKDHAPWFEEATPICGYKGYFPTTANVDKTPTKKSVFFIHFYLMSLACAISVLFFRAWFTFPLKFVSREHEVEFTESGIRRKTFKGWMLTVMTMNGWSTGEGPDRLRWNQINCLRRMEEGFTRLYPLPDTAFRRESLTYKLLNKLAAFMDGLSRRVDTADYLVFSRSANGTYGDHIKINLKELSREQRARLYYSVKQWAPHVEVHPSAEHELLGSNVLNDCRYTQLWFDILTSKGPRRNDLLNPEERLSGGKYKISGHLSSGGQATAYLAVNEKGETVVLKEFVLTGSADDGAALESAREFEAEVSLLSQLNNPGIVRLEDFFFEQGRVYVVLEYVEGISLKQLVQTRGRLPEAEVKRIAEALCDILEYMHAQVPAVVHRDVTPENILLKDDGTIKLIDFSLAVKQDGKPVTESCGKQCFTPPEQFRDEVCRQTDIYALGATMFFLLTGCSPKPISTSSPQAKVADVSDAMNVIVERATQLDVNQRYGAAKWLKMDLSGVCATGRSPQLQLAEEERPLSEAIEDKTPLKETIEVGIPQQEMARQPTQDSSAVVLKVRKLEPC